MDRNEIQLHVLGTGTAIVTKYHNTCFVLDDGEELFLVDGGGGGDILHQFEKHKLDFGHLHYGFLSHAHTDHLLGMVWVLRYIAYLMLRGDYSGDFILFTNEVTARKTDQVCRLLLQKREYALFGKRIHIDIVADRERRHFLNYRIVFFDIHSTKEKQYGFCLEYGDRKKLTFLGDEPLHDSCAEYVKNVDWMLSEAFCLHSEREYYNPYQYHHGTVKEAAQNAENGEVKNLVLWHTEDQTTYGIRKRVYAEEARQYYSGNVFVPDDDEIITVEMGDEL